MCIRDRLLVGESADVRKSTALKFAVKFFQAEMPDFNVAQGVQGSAEGLGKALELSLIHI